MKFYYLTITFFVIISSCSSNKKEYYDTGELKSEYKNKTYIEYFKNGKIKEEKLFNNNEKSYLKKVYFNNGILNWEANYQNNLENGIYKEFSKDGILITEAYYKEGKQDSITKIYFPNGKIHLINNFKNGIKDGKFQEFYQSGKPLMYAEYLLDSLVYYINIDEEQQVIDEYRKILLNAKDTVYVGKNLNCVVKIYGTILEEPIIEILFSDKKFEENLPFKILSSKNGEANYLVTPQKEGDYNIYLKVKIGKENEHFIIKKIKVLR